MDLTLVFAILSMVLMICTNFALKYRYITLIKASGFACVPISFAALFSIGNNQMLLLLIQGLAALAAVHVVYLSGVLRYSSNSYTRLSQKFKFYNISFYALTLASIIISAKIYAIIVTHANNLEISTILFLVFVKLVISSSLIWNRGNIYFKAIPPRNKKKIVLYVIDFIGISMYLAAIVLSSAHDRYILSILAVVFIVVKILNFIIFTLLFSSADHNRTLSIMSVSSLILFSIISFIGITLCAN